jgi:hypothetical protein
MVGYSVVIMVPILILVYQAACYQIQGLVGYSTTVVAIFVALFFTACVIVVRVFHVAEETMALGIIAAGLSLAFMVWAQVTAPAGPKKVPENGLPFILASALVSCF